MAALRAKFAELHDKTWMTAVLKQALAAGSSLNLSIDPTVRKFEIGRLLVAFSDEFAGDDEIFRALLHSVMGEEVQPAVTTGAAVAALTIEEARRACALLAGHFGRWNVVYDDNGPRFVAA